MEKAMSGLDAFAVGFTKFLIRIRWLVILASIAVAGYVSTGTQYLAYSNNYRTFFSDENPELRNFEEFQATYTKNDNFLFVLVPKDGGDVFNNDTLAAVGELTEEAWQLPYATRVDSVTNFQYTYAIEDDLIVEDLIPEPGETSEEELAQKRDVAIAEPLLFGQIISKDTKATAVSATLIYPEQSLSEVPEAVAEARALRDKILAAHPNVDIYLSGTSMLNNAFSEAVQADFMLLIPIMILVIIAITAIAVRSVSATFATVLLVILSTMVAMGWAGFVGIKLAGPSPSATIVILTLAIADSIHILMSVRAAMRAGLAKRDAIIEGMRINFLAVSITSLTTIVGFMSLNFSDSPPFRDLGNISAVGIVAAWAFSLTLLPALLSIIPFRVPAAPDGQVQGRIMTGLANVVIGHYRKFFVVLGAICVTLVAFIPQNELRDEFVKYFDQRIEFRRDTDDIVKYFGFYQTEYSLKAPGPGEITNPDYLRKLEAFTEWLRADPRIVHVYSVSDIMKRLNKNLNGDDPSFYRLPEEQDLAAQYLLLFELSLPFGLDLNDRINVDKSATRLTATMRGDVSTKDIRQLLRDTEEWMAANAPDLAAPATGPQIMFTFIAQRNVESMVRGTTIAIVLIAIVMIFALRSLPLGLLSMVPNGLPILSAFGAWAILNGQVGFSVAAVASISLGIVIDDTVHFLTKYQRALREKGLSVPDSIRYAFSTVGLAIFVNTIILGVGFAILTFSAFKINLELGLLTTMSIVFAFILDFLFLPALLLMVAGKGGEQRDQTDGGDYVGPQFRAQA